MAGQLSRRIARLVFGDYEWYRIYQCDLEELKPAVPSLSVGYRFETVRAGDVLKAKDPSISRRADYGGEGSRGFAVFHDDEIRCLQWYWFGERYKTRNFWPLSKGEAKSVEIYTSEEYRREGLAAQLKIFSAHEMRDSGYRRLYSRVWHSSRASAGVNEKAGWRFRAARCAAGFDHLGSRTATLPWVGKYILPESFLGDIKIGRSVDR